MHTQILKLISIQRAINKKILPYFCNEGVLITMARSKNSIKSFEILAVGRHKGQLRFLGLITC